LCLAAKINRARLAKVRRNDAALWANEPKRVTCVLKLHSAFQRLLFNMLANSVFTGAAGFNTVTALIERKFVEGSVEMNFAFVEMLAGHEERVAAAFPER